MKVYIVIHYVYSVETYTVLKVFSTLKKTKEYMNNHKIQGLDYICKEVIE